MDLSWIEALVPVPTAAVAGRFAYRALEEAVIRELHPEPTEGKHGRNSMSGHLADE